MLDIYICEDTAEILEHTKKTIENHLIIENLDAQLVLASSHPQEVLSHYQACQNPALFFLDIDLGTNINGIQLASDIRQLNKQCFIVFITTHLEMTLLTFQYKVEAMDFIVKPASTQQLQDCIHTALNRISQNKPNTLQIKVDDKTIYLDQNDIIYIETTPQRHKLRLHTQTRALEFNGKLSDFETQFVRTHKSFVVNPRQIKEKSSDTLVMTNGDKIPLSRTGKKLI